MTKQKRLTSGCSFRLGDRKAFAQRRFVSTLLLVRPGRQRVQTFLFFLFLVVVVIAVLVLVFGLVFVAMFDDIVKQIGRAVTVRQRTISLIQRRTDRRDAAVRTDVRTRVDAQRTTMRMNDSGFVRFRTGRRSSSVKNFLEDERNEVQRRERRSYFSRMRFQFRSNQLHFFSRLLIVGLSFLIGLDGQRFVGVVHRRRAATSKFRRLKTKEFFSNLIEPESGESVPSPRSITWKKLN